MCKLELQNSHPTSYRTKEDEPNLYIDELKLQISQLNKENIRLKSQNNKLSKIIHENSLIYEQLKQTIIKYDKEILYLIDEIYKLKLQNNKLKQTIIK